MTIDIGFSKIRDFEYIAKRIIENSQFHGVRPPVVEFVGTVKIHGCNLGICQKPDGRLIIQTRETIVSETNNFFGAYDFVQKNKETFEKIFDAVRKAHYPADYKDIYIFTEYFGQGIQRKVGVKHLERRVAILDIVIKEDEENKTKLGYKQLKNYHDFSNDYVKFITQYPGFKQVIDFGASEEVLKEVLQVLQDYTYEVEKHCPVAAFHLPEDFKEDLIGEGIVWQAINSPARHLGLTFKVKGVKHVKVKQPMSPEQLALLDASTAFAVTALESGRLEQGIFKLQEKLLDPKDIKNTGEYVRWVVGDVADELSDKIKELGLDTRSVAVAVGKKAAAYFREYLKQGEQEKDN